MRSGSMRGSGAAFTLILLTAVLVPCAAWAQTAGPVRIGVLHDITGPLAQIGSELN